MDPALVIPRSYNYALVLLSYLVAALGSYAFLQFATRIAELRDAGLRLSWLAIGAIAMGSGIWAMHFIGMLAHILPIPVAYDPGITALSIVPAIHVVARPVVTTPRLLVGGTLMGVGIGAMHYTGMSALQLEAVVRYDPTLFAASVGVAVLLAILALQTREWITAQALPQAGARPEDRGSAERGALSGFRAPSHVVWNAELRYQYPACQTPCPCLPISRPDATCAWISSAGLRCGSSISTISRPIS